MDIHASGEDYLEAILMLQKKNGMVRSVDLARHMGFSKPSISHAVGVLKGGGFLTVDGADISRFPAKAISIMGLNPCRFLVESPEMLLS